jgi:hypothetical protein
MSSSSLDPFSGQCRVTNTILRRESEMIRISEEAAAYVSAVMSKSQLTEAELASVVVTGTNLELPPLTVNTSAAEMYNQA